MGAGCDTCTIWRACPEGHSRWAWTPVYFKGSPFQSLQPFKVVQATTAVKFWFFPKRAQLMHWGAPPPRVSIFWGASLGTEPVLPMKLVLEASASQKAGMKENSSLFGVAGGDFSAPSSVAKEREDRKKVAVKAVKDYDDRRTTKNGPCKICNSYHVACQWKNMSIVPKACFMHGHTRSQATISRIDPSVDR